MYLSKRIQALGVSPTRKYNQLAKEVEARGTRILRLSVGQPDLPAPELFFERIAHPKTHKLPYADSPGLADMRNAQSRYYAKKGLEFKPEEIFITTGATEALMFSMLTCCDPGDSFLLVEPFYTNYALLTGILGLNVDIVRTGIESNYEIPSVEEMEKSLTPSTRAILFANPGNPTGRVYTEEELDRLVELAVKHDLYIISDEVYREFNFSGRPFKSLAEYPEAAELLILLDSASKKYAACGARVGSIATKNKTLAAQFMKLCQMRLAAPTLDQWAVAGLVELPDSYFEEVDALYRRRKAVLAEALSRIEGVKYSNPEGAFYTLASLPVENADDFVVWTLSEFSDNGETFLPTPAEPFYLTPGAGKNEIRISYAVDEKVLTRACEIMAAALKAYRAR